MARVNNTQAYTTCPLFQTKSTHLKFRSTLIYGTSASNILLRRVYNLHIHYYLSVQTRLYLSVQTRLPFSLSTIKFDSPFNLLHCDIWGTHKTPTHLWKTFFFYNSRWLYSMYLGISHESQVWNPTSLKIIHYLIIINLNIFSIFVLKDHMSKRKMFLIGKSW